MVTKVCRECRQEKPITSFYKNNINKDGRTHFCDVCKKRYTAEYRKKHIESAKLAVRRWNDANRERKRQYCREYRLKNKEKVKAAIAEWHKRNPAWRAVHSADYRVGKMQRTPTWLTAEHKAQIKEFYTLAKELQWLANDELVVDHIVPLRGKIVSGLHVPWNLQIISNYENSVKKNEFKW